VLLGENRRLGEEPTRDDSKAPLLHGRRWVEEHTPALYRVTILPELV